MKLIEDITLSVTWGIEAFFGLFKESQKMLMDHIFHHVNIF